MTCSKQDKPYKSIDLNFSQTFAVLFALRDRERVLLKDLSIKSLSPETVVECEKQLTDVRVLLAVLEMR